MKKSHFLTIILPFLFCLSSCDKKTTNSLDIEKSHHSELNDPLSLWNDGETKKAIIQYVSEVTEKGNPKFIPEADRIATFDNDGTLWAEKPLVQELFAFYVVKKMVKKDPSLAKKQPFKAVIEKDSSYFAQAGEKGLIELVAATHTNISEDDFEVLVKECFNTVKHPTTNKPIKSIVYTPQLQLLNYLRQNGFKTYICTGGTIEFVRGISDVLYQIPKEQVIGSSFQYVFNDSLNTVYRNAKLNSYNDKQVKPTNIQLHIGKHPVFACGNEGAAGDIAMLEYSQKSKYPSFQLLINHDDREREFYYQEKDSASIKAALKNKWYVVSIKNDWNQVFEK